MEDLQKKLNELKEKLNIEQKKKQISKLETQSGQPEFWVNYQEAAQKMKELNELQKEMEEVKLLEEKIQSGNKEEAEKLFEKLKFKLFLSGPHDASGCILSIHSGQGGVEAMDWAQMLWRMYTRFAEKRGWEWEEIDKTAGEEAGIKSSTIVINGSYAYGFLKGEAGVHRLVRQSPFNADKLRQTSFALVEVLPIIADPQEIQIKNEEIVFEAFRASGHGGQNVNKVSTAVRLKHIPTGIVVSCQTERYQAQNRENALKILRAKLWEIKEKERKKEESKLKGEYKIAGWGNQIRSYVLHPYHLVKDLRTGFETTKTDAVLNGEIDGFIEAELKLKTQP